MITSDQGRKKLNGWQIDCAAFLDEPGPSAEPAGQQPAQHQVPHGYLFQGQLSQVALLAVFITAPKLGSKGVIQQQGRFEGVSHVKGYTG